MAQEMGFTVANDVNEALEMAIKEKGKDAHISIIPDGVSVMVKKPADSNKSRAKTCLLNVKFIFRIL